ncbi:hypothetical protein VC218_07020 [Xanthomonas nasturtii]|uniref:hypothetical protein n=1 Tax=Xanthomonas nasturtii TaxID=1843581 RepID=UPI002B22B9CC|nr:hypothetical protein [Xanthomonas nasturtii]MEA9578673.1 hypothetical protein [Xanthomonas nasturtii]
MRDDKDTRTAELPIAGRSGRPPANGLRAMTDAERAHAYRLRRKELRSALVLKRGGWRQSTDSMLIDRIRDACQLPPAKRAKAIMMYAEELASRTP